MSQSRFVFLLLGAASCAPRESPIAPNILIQNYVPNAADPTPVEALDLSRSFLKELGREPGQEGKVVLKSRLEAIGGQKRSVWSVLFERSPGVVIDMKHRKVVQYADGIRDWWELRGTEPKQPPVVAEADARRYAEDLAHRLGVPADLRFSSFGCSPMGGKEGRSLVCGGSFQNRSGQVVASIRVDLVDGGLHTFDYWPWKLEAPSQPGR